MAGPETIDITTSFYLANSGEVLVSMLTLSGVEVATADGTPLRIMVSGTVNINPFMANEEQAIAVSRPGGFPGDMRPFPQHWYGPRITGTFTTYETDVYRKLTFLPVTVVDGIAAVAFAVGATGTSDPVTVALYNSDRNNWPSTLVWSTVYDAGLSNGEQVEIAGPDTVGSQPTIPDGLYWLTVVSFDDAAFFIRMLCDYNSVYTPVGNAPFPSYGDDLQIALSNSLTGGGGQCVIHSSSIGGAFVETITELPTTVTPGVDANGNYYQPLMFIKSAWGG